MQNFFSICDVQKNPSQSDPGKSEISNFSLQVGSVSKMKTSQSTWSDIFLYATKRKKICPAKVRAILATGGRTRIKNCVKIVIEACQTNSSFFFRL